MKINITVNAPDVLKAAQTVAEALNGMNIRSGPAPIKRGEAPQAPEAPTKRDEVPPMLEQLCAAATPLVDAGRGGELRALLKSKYGVDAMTKLPREAYGALAADLKAMGAKI